MISGPPIKSPPISGNTVRPISGVMDDAPKISIADTIAADPAANAGGNATTAPTISACSAFFSSFVFAFFSSGFFTPFIKEHLSTKVFTTIAPAKTTERAHTNLMA